MSIRHVPKVPRKKLRIVLPYLRNMSNITNAKLIKAVNKILKFYQIKVPFFFKKKKQT